MHVVLDRLFRKIQLVGDLLVGEAEPNELHKLLLAACQANSVSYVETGDPGVLSHMVEQGQAQLRRTNRFVTDYATNRVGYF